MESDDSEVPDVVYTLDIQPYQFEPVRDSSNRLPADNSGSEDSKIDDTDKNQQDRDRLLNTTW